jgi:hypothetical protein
LKAYARDIFFTKLTDWASEMEYRFVLPTDHEQPVLVPIRDALKAVIIGEGVSDVYLPAISKACEEKTDADLQSPLDLRSTTTRVQGHSSYTRRRVVGLA